MSSADTIQAILKRGTKCGVDALAPSERKVWLISEAEVLCDMEGINSFLDRNEALLPEVADAFVDVGAIQIAESFRAIHAMWPAPPNELLDRASALVTARTGYAYDSVLRLVSGAA